MKPNEIFYPHSASEKVMSADNQQERLDNTWVVGFVDGEGCFHTAINRQPRMKLGWQVLPEFRIVQHKDDTALLNRLQSFFGCGIVTRNHANRNELRIRGINNLINVVDFFYQNPLQTRKRYDFELFSSIIHKMRAGEHLTSRGLKSIAKIAASMNRRVTPKYLVSS